MSGIDADLTSLSHCVSLKVAQFQLSQGCVKFLNECQRLHRNGGTTFPRGLRVLDISVVCFSEDVLSIVAACFGSLARLKLTCCGVKGDDLIALASLDTLRELDFSNCEYVVEQHAFFAKRHIR